MKPKTLLQVITLIVLQCLLSATLVAQTTPPPKQWDKRFGGISDEGLTSLRQTADGGYILGGESSSGIGGDKTQDSRGNADYWIVKIDANGIKQWDKRFGGNSYDQLNCLRQTTDGGYILGGYSWSDAGGDITEDNRGAFDCWIVKIDANGIKQWDKRYGGNSGDELVSLQQTMDGGYILGGSSSSNIGGDKTENSRGGYDYWIVKIDANGTKQWDKCFGGISYDYLYDVHQTTDGGYILGGLSLSSTIGGDKTATGRGFSDFWVVKVDASGIKQWDRCFGGSDGDALKSLQQTTDGGYILGGWSDSGISGDKTEASRGYSDFWIVKVDASGIKQWDKRYGGSNGDELKSLQQTTDGGFILGGYSGSGISGDKTEDNRGNSDYWIIKTDAKGIKQWDKRYGGNDFDGIGSLQQTTDGAYILGGYSYSAIGGDKTENSRGGDDFWLVKLGCQPEASISHKGNLDICGRDSVLLQVNSTDTLRYQWLRNGVKIKGAIHRNYIATDTGKYKVIVYSSKECYNTSNAFTVTNSCSPVAINNTGQLQTSNIEHPAIYPNPSKGNITVAYAITLSGEIQLNVFDITGKKLYTKTVQAIAGNNTYQLNLTHLAAGIYNLQLINGAEKKDIRFVIEK